jgi:hypothetical protein
MQHFKILFIVLSLASVQLWGATYTLVDAKGNPVASITPFPGASIADVWGAVDSGASGGGAGGGLYRGPGARIADVWGSIVEDDGAATRTAGAAAPREKGWSVKADGTIEIDLRASKVGAPTLGTILADGEFPKEGGITLNLSKGYMDDSGAGTLVVLLGRTKLTPRITRLNLSNNRIGADGLLKFSELLQEPSFQYLDLSINHVDQEAIRDLTTSLDFDTRSKRAREANPAAILGSWVAKVIWLPKGMDFDKLPLPKSIRDAHKAYYAGE